jgi:hypothetical protein
VVEIDLAKRWSIVSPAAGPVASLAAAELAATLERVAGHPFPVEAEASGGRPVSGPAIVLSHDGGEGEGFRWQARPERVELRGAGPRGLLYAAYSFLETLGCRWVAPGAEGERLPCGARFELPDGEVAEAPALPGRCLIVGHYAFMQDVEEWIVWAARNRLNTLFAHVIGGPLALAAAPERQWQARKEAAVALARQRGMTVEYGGHGLAALLPRKLFKQMPQAFRMHRGRRTPDHNFCPSSAEGLAVVRRNAEAYFRARPEVDVFHLWPDDIPGGGWCGCERCRAYTSSEQALLAVNAVAEVLEGVNPAAQIGFLAYMDTEEVPRRVVPRRNVSLLWAPRSRCYAHAADDEACPVNVPRYRDTFSAQVAHFRAAGAPPARVFEYYLDAVLFKSLLPPLPATIQRDVRFYRRAGAHTVQALMTGDRPWLAPQVNAWLFARLCWDPDQDLDVLLDEFGRAVLGIERGTGGERLLAAYYHALEAAFALALDIAPEQLAELDVELSPMGLVDNPPPDMGDPAFASLEVLRLKCQANAAIAGLVEEAARHLEAAQKAARAAGAGGAWAAERAAFDLARAWLRFDLARVCLYEGVASLPVAADVRERFAAAQGALDEVLAWGEAHIADPRFRRNYAAIHHMFWRLRLDKIRAEHLVPGAVGWALRVKSLVQMAWTFLRLRGIYGA